MFLACPQCSVNYRLDDLALGATGRKVRCTTCGHVWHAVPPAPEDLPPAPVPGPFTNTDPIPEEAMSVSFDDSRPLSHPVEDFAAVPPEFASEADAVVDDWPDVAVETIEARPPREEIPEVVKPTTAATADAGEDIAHFQPAGMSANAFGTAVFLLPLLLTAGVLVALKNPLARNLPALAPIYGAVGLSVQPPGEGLRLSTLVAERRVDNETKTLALTAQLANVSPVAKAYPPLVATVRGPYGAVLKTWALPAPDGRRLASGEESPIKVEFKDVPDAAAVVELKVREE